MAAADSYLCPQAAPVCSGAGHTWQPGGCCQPMVCLYRVHLMVDPTAAAWVFTRSIYISVTSFVDESEQPGVATLCTLAHV